LHGAAERESKKILLNSVPSGLFSTQDLIEGEVKSPPFEISQERSISMKKMLALSISRSVPRLLSLSALAIMLSVIAWLVSPNTSVQAQSPCLLACQQSYLQCLANPDPVPEGFCETAYDNCVEACLGSSIDGPILAFTIGADDLA